MSVDTGISGIPDRGGIGHVCPGPLCTKPVPYDMLACAGHWYQVSKQTRALVWRTWRNGNGAGSDAHSRAITQAISEMRPFKSDM